MIIKGMAKENIYKYYLKSISMNIIKYISNIFCQPVKSNFVWPRNRFFEDTNVLLSEITIIIYFY